MKITLFFIFYIAKTIASAWTLFYLWSWFIAPTFNMAQVSVPQAAGVMTI